jgi:predicted 2-oxoglutarate/Fe(II)-dependent dioxygenase YbiX
MSTYDPKKHLFSFLGNQISDGFAENFLKVSMRADAYELTVGASGEAAFSKTNDNTGEVEVTLMAQSLANDTLSAIHAADKLGGTGVGPLFIKELNGATVVHSQNARIKRAPDLERAKIVGTVTWTFLCADLEIYHGGHL